MAKLSPIGNVAQFINGIPANGAKLFTYAAGSSTKQTTYTDEDGLTQQANPIILDSRGEPSQPIWLTEGLSYKFVFAPSTDSDPPAAAIWDVDDVTGINDASVSIDQWVDSGLTPTYVSATSFTVPGDQTSIFTNKRRVKSTVTAGTAYSSVISAVFGALTTVTVVNDSTTLDSGLSAVQLGLITLDNTSLPSIVESFRATVAATATTTPLWASTAQIQDWTGTPTITNFPAATRAGLWRTVYPAAGTIFTDNANIDVQGDATYTSEAGDKFYIEALTTSTFKVWIDTKDGAPVLLPDATTSVKGAVELATDAEFVTGTSTSLVPPVSSIRAGLKVVGTPVATTSGTTQEFTSIPSWVKKITVMPKKVSTNGVSALGIQLGDASSYETTGYDSFATMDGSTPTRINPTNLLPFISVLAAAGQYTGTGFLTKYDGNTWVWNAAVGTTNATTQGGFGTGEKTLTGTLTRLRITTASADTFDNGAFNIAYE